MFHFFKRNPLNQTATYSNLEQYKINQNGPTYFIFNMYNCMCHMGVYTPESEYDICFVLEA